jgi:hypothetical protein
MNKLTVGPAQAKKTELYVHTIWGGAKTLLLP